MVCQNFFWVDWNPATWPLPSSSHTQTFAQLSKWAKQCTVSAASRVPQAIHALEDSCFSLMGPLTSSVHKRVGRVLPRLAPATLQTANSTMMAHNMFYSDSLSPSIPGMQSKLCQKWELKTTLTGSWVLNQMFQAESHSWQLSWQFSHPSGSRNYCPHECWSPRMEKWSPHKGFFPTPFPRIPERVVLWNADWHLSTNS